MINQNYEYLLYVWERKPEEISDLCLRYWKRHVVSAHSIPRIGEAIVCSGFDAYNRFRIFEVRHTVKGGLAELVMDGMSELRPANVPDGQEGLVQVYGYRED